MNAGKRLRKELEQYKLENAKVKFNIYLLKYITLNLFIFILSIN